MLEKERGNSGHNRTIKKIPSYIKTITSRRRERERERDGEGKEREGKSEWLEWITAGFYV